MTEVSPSVGERTGGYNAIMGYGKVNAPTPDILEKGIIPNTPVINPMVKWRMKQRPDPSHVKIQQCDGVKGIPQGKIDVAYVKSHQSGYKTVSKGVIESPYYNPAQYKFDKTLDKTTDETLVSNKEKATDVPPTLEQANKEASRWKYGFKAYTDGQLTGAKPVITQGYNQEVANPKVAWGDVSGGRVSGFKTLQPQTRY